MHPLPTGCVTHQQSLGMLSALSAFFCDSNRVTTLYLHCLQAGDDAGAALVETRKDKLIRQGLLTPFDALAGFEMQMTGSDAGDRRQRQQQQLLAQRRAAALAAARRSAAAAPSAHPHYGKIDVTALDGKVGRKGLLLAESVAAATQRAVELSTTRPSTRVMDKDDLPQQVCVRVRARLYQICATCVMGNRFLTDQMEQCQECLVCTAGV